MSDHDHRILSLAELSVTETGKLLGRRRQTIHRGINNEAQYFQLPDLIAILRYAESKDNRQHVELQRYVLKYYAAAHLKTNPAYRLLFPGSYRLDQLKTVTQETEQIVFVLTDNTAAFDRSTVMTALLEELIASRPDDVDVVLSCNHSEKTYAQRFAFARQPLVLKGPALLAPVILFRNATGERAFAALCSDVCELSLQDARAVWDKCWSAGVREKWRPRPRRKKK